MSKEALTLALAALEDISTALREEDVLGSNIEMLLNAITAIREALAQPEQYSDIVSDGGLDPRNKFDAQLEHPALGSIC